MPTKFFGICPDVKYEVVTFTGEKRMSKESIAKRTDGFIHASIVKDREMGMSIVSVLVAAGLAGILGLVVSKQMTNQIKYNAKSQQVMDQHDLRRYVTSALSCQQTAMKSDLKNCHKKKAKPIDLYRQDGSILVSWKGASLGEWSMVAVCKENRIMVGAGKKVGGKWIKDPLNASKTMNPYLSENDLYKNAIPLCPGIFDGKGQPTTAGEQRCKKGELLKGIRQDGSIICEAPQIHVYKPQCTDKGNTLTVTHTHCSLAKVTAWTFGYSDTDDTNCITHYNGGGSWNLHTRCHDINSSTDACHYVCYD